MKIGGGAWGKGAGHGEREGGGGVIQVNPLSATLTLTWSNQCEQWGFPAVEANAVLDEGSAFSLERTVTPR